MKVLIYVHAARVMIDVRFMKLICTCNRSFSKANIESENLID